MIQFSSPFPLSIVSYRCGEGAFFTKRDRLPWKTRTIKAGQTQQVERFTNNRGNVSSLFSPLSLSLSPTNSRSRVVETSLRNLPFVSYTVVDSKNVARIAARVSAKRKKKNCKTNGSTYFTICLSRLRRLTLSLSLCLSKFFLDAKRKH